jgi:hypothetical protein
MAAKTLKFRLRELEGDWLCVYNETGNVIETHEHAGGFREP